MMLTLEQEAYFLYLEHTYPCVVVLPDNTMYGAESFGDATSLLVAEHDWKQPEATHGQ